MSEHEAKIGDKIKLVDLPKGFSERLNVGDELTVNGFEGIYVRAYLDDDVSSLFLPHEYEVLTIEFEPKEVKLTKRQLESIRYFFQESPKKESDFEYVLNRAYNKDWNVERFKCLNDLTTEQIAIVVLRPDKIKIVPEIKYEKINPVTAFELWRDESKVYFKRKSKEEWKKVHGGIPLSIFKGESYEFSIKKTI